MTTAIPKRPVRRGSGFMMTVWRLAVVFLSITRLCAEQAAPARYHFPHAAVNKSRSYIDIPAVFHPGQFNSGSGLKNHHLIVFKDGKAAGNALFVSPVSDSAVHDSLVAIGATPGNNLTRETWTKWKSKRSSEPDKTVEGSHIDILILRRQDTLDITDILHDRSATTPEFRFGGNRKLIPVWKSGCIACLQSCPGGKIGNARYTMRDLADGVPEFTLAPGNPLRDGEKVIIRFSVHDTNQ
ncbi:MAG: hypothetical protein GF350_06380 [Chitinivibrionales bacterium]|nr:hypothetical protein [Chitinivibrionales bacterium]